MSHLAQQYAVDLKTASDRMQYVAARIRGRFKCLTCGGDLKEIRPIQTHIDVAGFCCSDACAGKLKP